MGYPTKVQLIKRKTSEQWYINFPSAVAQAMEFCRGEVVEWLIEDKETLVLHRPEAPGRKLKKKPQQTYSQKSKSFLPNVETHSDKSGAGSEGDGSS